MGREGEEYDEEGEGFADGEDGTVVGAVPERMAETFEIVAEGTPKDERRVRIDCTSAPVRPEAGEEDTGVPSEDAGAEDPPPPPPDGENEGLPPPPEGEDVKPPPPPPPEGEETEAGVMAETEEESAEVFPSASYARTVYEYDVDGERFESVYEVVPRVAIREPFRYSLYPAAEGEESQERVIWPEEAEAEKFEGITGGVEVETGEDTALLTVTVTLEVESLPEVSYAVAERVCVPFEDVVVSHENV